MRIVIDYQGAQSDGSRNRGIGRYTASVTKAIIRTAPDAEIVVLLNGAFSNTIEPIRAEFDALLPQDNIVVWEPLRPIGHIHRENDDRRRASELLREACISRLNPDALLITSHFEGSGNDGATTVGLLPASYPTAVILYDLIPYIYRSIYLSDPAVERWYEERLGNLKRADLLLAISESSRQEAIDYLGYPADRVVNVSTAADSHFKRVKLRKTQRDALFARYGITKPFVMYTGGIDHRKNIEGLVRAFAKLPAKVRRKHQLAIVCSMRPEDGPRLRGIAQDAGVADDLILTGFVPEEDLIALYSSCKLFVFPSWHEGFGLPALEAMRCGAPVIAGSRSSLPEVIGDPIALFDPRRDESIKEKMATALQDEDFRQQLIKNSRKRAPLFSWDAIGERVVTAITSSVISRKRDFARPARLGRRPRLAMVTPVPPAETGIAYYASSLIRALQEYYEIDVVVKDGVATDDPFLLANCAIVDATSFRKRAGQYDRVVYQLGNSDHHNHMVDLISECPGVVVLHDFFISDLSSWREHLGGVYGNWGYDLYESHGVGALLERHTEPNLFSVINKYPCSYAVTRHALGVLCHSEQAKALQVSWHGDEAARDWTVVPMIRPQPKLPPRADARQALGIRADDFVVCAYGILGRSKLNHTLLDAWISSKLGLDKRCRLIFVGGHGPGDYYNELRGKVAAHKAAERVEFSGWVEEEQYWQYLAAADVAVQLRGITHGETSAATLDAMLAGLPVIANVSSSLPNAADEAIAYVPAEAPINELADALDRLYHEPEIRKRLGAAARRYASDHHSESVCARKFADAVERRYRSSAESLRACINGLAGLQLTETEANELSTQFAALINQQPTLYLDITGLHPDFEQIFDSLIRPLLLGIAEHRPNLRLVAVERSEQEYVSALQSILNAAKYPHIHHAKERVLLKSTDWLVSINSTEENFARQLARTAGSKVLEVEARSGTTPAELERKILDFVESGCPCLLDLR